MLTRLQRRMRQGNFTTTASILAGILSFLLIPKPMGLTLLLRASIVLVVLLLRLAPTRHREYALVATETYLLLVIVFMNRFRLLRLSIIDEPSDAPYDKVWETCDVDLAIHARDAIEVLYMVTIQVPFAFFRSRAIISWIAPACAITAFASVLIVPALRLADGGGTFILLLFAFGGSFTLWVLCLFNERDHRELWAMSRIRETEAKWQREFVNIMFTAVVQVQQGKIAQGSALEPHFGREISEVLDLECLKDHGGYESSIADLVNEVEITSMPAKRKVLLRPHGLTVVFDCTVCAFFQLDSAATILGFEIRESWANEPAQIDIPGLQDNSGDDNVTEDTTEHRERIPKIKANKLRLLDWSSYRSEAVRPAMHGATAVDVWFRDELSGPGSDAASSTADNLREEVQKMLICRHPSILHLFGKVNLQKGPALVTERTDCSVANLLDQGLISFSSGVRIMYQISTAMAYMHELEICHCAIEAENVQLIQRVFIDPIAKLSNFSNSKYKSWFFRKDIEDFAALLSVVSGLEYPLEDGDDRDRTTQPAIASGDEGWAQRASLQGLIVVASHGGIAASQIALRLSDVDAELRAGSRNFSASGAASRPNTGQLVEIENLLRCGGCFRFDG